MNDVLNAHEVVESLRSQDVELRFTDHAEDKLRKRSMTKKQIREHLQQPVQGILLQPPEPRIRLWVEMLDEYSQPYSTAKDLILIIGESYNNAYNLITAHPQSRKERHHD